MKNYLKFAAAVVTAGVTLGAAPSAMAAGDSPQTLCSGAAGVGTDVSFSTTGTLFVRTSFKPQCSANVLLVTDQNPTGFWGGAVSTKGKNRFGGSSNGGAIRAITTCTAACAATDASSARDVAETFGVSS